jgi:hypothetical protein
MNGSFAEWNFLGLKLFSSSDQNTSLHAFFPFNVLLTNLLLFMGLPLYVI